MQPDVVRGENIISASSSSSGGGETLRLTAPVRGDVIILVDPALSGSPFSSGIMTLPPGGGLPAHRLLQREELFFFHKGQGRLTVDGRSITVVPGVSHYIPRGAAQQLRNTGTGVLQFTWTTAPAGHEQFFRELARVTDPGALPALFQRYGVELLAEGAAVEPPPAGHRRRHRGRGRDRSLPPAATLPSPPRAERGAPGSAGGSQSELSAPSALVPAAPPSGGGSRRRRRHRGGRGRSRGGASPPAPAPQSSAKPVSPPPPAAPKPQAGAKRPERAGSGSPDRRRDRRGFRRGHVKEVYMGGKWIRVAGEGPVISTGQQPPPPED